MPDIMCAALFTPTVTRKAGQNILTVSVCFTSYMRAKTVMRESRGRVSWQ